MSADPNPSRAVESDARLVRTIADHPGVELAVQGGATATMQWRGHQTMAFATFPLFAPKPPKGSKGGDVAMMLADEWSALSESERLGLHHNSGLFGSTIRVP